MACGTFRPGCRIAFKDPSKMSLEALAKIQEILCAGIDEQVDKPSCEKTSVFIEMPKSTKKEDVTLLPCALHVQKDNAILPKELLGIVGSYLPVGDVLKTYAFWLIELTRTNTPEAGE